MCWHISYQHQPLKHYMLELPSFFSTSFHMYLASISCLSVEEDGMTLTYLVVYIGTPTHRHNSKIGNGQEVNFCLALMAILFDVSNPRSILLLDMIQPCNASLGSPRTYSFWDGMMVLLMKRNKNMAAIFKSLFTIGALTPIHLLVSFKIIRENDSFRWYNNSMWGSLIRMDGMQWSSHHHI